MVLNIDGDFFLTLVLVIFALCAFGPIMDRVVIPVLENTGKFIKTLWGYGVAAAKWAHTLKWYYKIPTFIVGFVVFGLLSSNYSQFWIDVLFVWFFLCIFYFACWCVDMLRKLYNVFGKWNKNPPKKDFESI